MAKWVNHTTSTTNGPKGFKTIGSYPLATVYPWCEKYRWTVWKDGNTKIARGTASTLEDAQHAAERILKWHKVLSWLGWLSRGRR